MLNDLGLINQAWADWFTKAFQRMGGHISYTNDESIITERIEDEAVTAAKLAASVAGDGLSGGAGSALSVSTDNSTLEVSGDQVRAKDLGITPAKLAGSIPFAKFLSTDWSSSHASGGYQKLPSGLYLQWGVTGSLSSGTTTSTSFTTAFPTACLQVFASVRNNSAVATGANGQWGTGNYSTTAFDLYNRTSVALTFNWFAIGN
jgi:hypothetical protein